MDSPRVLITAVADVDGWATLQALKQGPFECYAADCEPYAGGLFDLPAGRRLLLRQVYDPGFLTHLLGLCERLGISLLVPGRPEEMLVLGRARESFQAQGVRILCEGAENLERLLDHWKLLAACAGAVPAPKSALLGSDFDPANWRFPVLVKPRWQGLGVRGALVERPGDLFQFPWGDHLLVQEYLPGEESVVELLPGLGLRPAVLVPTVRLRSEGGGATAVRMSEDPEPAALALELAEHLSLRGPASIRFRRDGDDRLVLVDVRPGFTSHALAGVAAGINLPALAAADALGRQAPAGSASLGEVALVARRRLEAVPLGELEALEDELLRLAVASGGVGTFSES